MGDSASGELTQSFLQTVPVVAGQGEFGAIVENDVILTMKPRLQFLDAIDTDYGGAMNAQELFWIQLGLEAGDGFSQQMSLLTGVHGNIVSFRLNPINIVGFEEVNAA